MWMMYTAVSAGWTITKVHFLHWCAEALIWHVSYVKPSYMLSCFTLWSEVFSGEYSNLSTQSNAWQEFSSMRCQWKKNYLYLILTVRDCLSALAVSVKAFATTATANIKRKIHHHHHLTMFQGWCNMGKCQKFVPALRQKDCFTQGLELFNERKKNNNNNMKMN